MQNQIKNTIHSMVADHQDLLTILNEFHSIPGADISDTHTWVIALAEAAILDFESPNCKQEQAFDLMHTLKHQLTMGIFPTDNMICWESMGTSPIFKTWEDSQDHDNALCTTTGQSLLITFSDFTMTITYNSWQV